jgi:hypothetical protein
MEFPFVSEINRVEDAYPTRNFSKCLFLVFGLFKNRASLGIFIKLAECENAIPITDMEIFYDISMTETISIPRIAQVHD